VVTFNNTVSATGKWFGITTGGTGNTINIGGILPNGSQLLVYDPISAYTTFTKKSTGAWNGAPTLNVGSGFFARTTNATPVTWIQNVGP